MEGRVRALEFSAGPKAVGPYSLAVRVGDLIFFSGMLPIVPETGELIVGDIGLATERILLNLNEMLKELGLTPSHIVKTTIYTTRLEHFASINEAYRRFFDEHGGTLPARTTVGVAGLPRGAEIEMEFIVSSV